MQMPNDPTIPPPPIGAKRHLSFAPEHAVVLADAAVRGRA